MLIKLIGAVGLVIAGVFIYAAMQPSRMNISREAFVKASPEVIFPYINNSKKSNEWMPWKESDPNVEMIYSGPDEGVGSTTTWDSKGQMGKGRARVVESIPNQSVKTELTYTRPMEMSQLAEVSLTPSSDGTVVRWSVTGENSFMGKVFALFMDMDEMVGKEFDKGLNNLKAKVESAQ